ncbi:MAG: hypothetical protein JW881_20080 [Spirochaetales bacterium]|nr:hypothetical protein [Spirochaetales bacterium]
MKQHIFTVTCLTVIILFFTACMAEEYSVFWSIHLTEKETDNSLDNNLTIGSMSDDGSTYFISTGGSILKKSVTAASSASWKKISLPRSGAFCTGITLYGGNLYAGFLINESETALYRTAPDPVSWQEEVDADIAGKQIVRLVEANGVLFVVAMDESEKFGLYYFNGAIYQPATLSGLSHLIVTVIWDGSAYWTIAGNRLYSGANPESLAEVTTDPLQSDSGNKYGGILFAGTHYYLSADNGKVYRSDDGFASSEGSEKKTVSQKTVKFTEFTEVGGNVLVGTTSFGFYQMEDGTVGGLDRIDEKEMLDTELDRCHVMRFHVHDDKVYFLTAAQGLYSNTYSGTWSGTWVHE